MLKELIYFAFAVAFLLPDRPTLAAAIRSVKLGDIATVPTRDLQPAWCVEGKRSAAIEMACVALVTAAIMVKIALSVDGPLSFHVSLPSP